MEFLRNEGLTINAGIFGYFNRNSSDNIWIKEYYKVNPTSKQIVSNVIFDDSLPQMYVLQLPINNGQTYYYSTFFKIFSSYQKVF